MQRYTSSDVASQLTIGSSRYLLVEMPAPPWTDTMYRELEGLYVRRGITPIVAHVDRYIGRFRTFGIPQRLEELPVLVQANGTFFTERSTAGMALRMLKQGRIHLLGSDCHNLTSRKPNLGAAVERIRKHLKEDVLEGIRAWEQDVLGKDL